jgi:hypothetical protein
MDDTLKRLLDRTDKRLARIERDVALAATLSVVPPESGIHVLKDAWRETDYLREYCEALAPKLQLACDRTRTVVKRYLRSERDKHYLVVGEQEAGTYPEAVLEKKVCEKWRGVAMIESASLWHKLVQNQVPLKARQESETGLKAIDLLATSENGIPVVIELKVCHKQCDTPLLALLEAASYACVLQADWMAFRNEWIEALRKLQVDTNVPESLSGCNLVIAATPAYWSYWKNSQRKSMIQARPAFKQLLREFCALSFPVRFASIDENTIEISEYQFP